MMKELRNEPRFDKDIPIQVAGDLEKRSYAERCKKGIPLKLFEYGGFKKISEEYGVDSIHQFLKDVKQIKKDLVRIGNLERKITTLKNSRIPTKVLEAVNNR